MPPALPRLTAPRLLDTRALLPLLTPLKAVEACGLGRFIAGACAGRGALLGRAAGCCAEVAGRETPDEGVAGRCPGCWVGTAGRFAPGLGICEGRASEAPDAGDGDGRAIG